MTLTPVAAGGAFTKVAATPYAGVALINGTQSILSWTAPDDGKMHHILLGFMEDVTSVLTGGTVRFAIVLPDGTVYNLNVGAANASAGPHANAVGQSAFLIQAGSTVLLSQVAAMTAGAALVWAEFYAS